MIGGERHGNGHAGRSRLERRCTRLTCTCMRGLLILASVVLLAGCTPELEGQVRALTARAEAADRELAAAKTKLDEATKTISQVEAGKTQVEVDKKACEDQRAELTEENKRLKETAQAYLNEAAELVKGDTDVADFTAISKLKELIEKFPSDPLAAVAAERIEESKQRVVDRAAALEAAQKRVRRLIAACKQNTAAASRARDGSLVFNFLGDIDLNSAMEGNRRASAFEKKAATAKKDATALLQSVPDPDGSLAAAVEV